MNSTEIVNKFVECQLHKAVCLIHMGSASAADTSCLEPCKTDLIEDIDNYGYNYNYERYVFLYLWLLFIAYIIYINNPFLYIMKKGYHLSLYVVGYKEKHNHIQMLENKIEIVEDALKYINNDLHEYMKIIDKKVKYDEEYITVLAYNREQLIIKDRLTMLENTHTETTTLNI